LAKARPLTLEAIAAYPLVTYDPTFAGRTSIDRAFAARHLSPEIALTALDSDVIKSYVSLGLGVGVISSRAFRKGKDEGLKALDFGAGPRAHLELQAEVVLAEELGEHLAAEGAHRVGLVRARVVLEEDGSERLRRGPADDARAGGRVVHAAIGAAGDDLPRARDGARCVA